MVADALASLNLGEQGFLESMSNLPIKVRALVQADCLQIPMVRTVLT